MTLTVKITTGDAALEDRHAETARILTDLAARIERQGWPDRGDPYKLADINGNTIGTAATGSR